MIRHYQVNGPMCKGYRPFDFFQIFGGAVSQTLWKHTCLLRAYGLSRDSMFEAFIDRFVVAFDPYFVAEL